MSPRGCGRAWDAWNCTCTVKEAALLHNENAEYCQFLYLHQFIQESLICLFPQGAQQSIISVPLSVKGSKKHVLINIWRQVAQFSQDFMEKQVNMPNTVKVETK